jgi:hypothetical protein
LLLEVPGCPVIETEESRAKSTGGTGLRLANQHDKVYDNSTRTKYANSNMKQSPELLMPDRQYSVYCHSFPSDSMANGLS